MTRARSRAERDALAAEVWRSLFGFFMSTRPQRDRVLADRGITPGDARALSSLDTQVGRTLSELALEWGCDASTVTWSVDRLERLGLARRAPHPSDRRAKLVRLTEHGSATRAALYAEMLTVPAELLTLDNADLRALRDVLAKLPNHTAETGAEPATSTPKPARYAR